MALDRCDEENGCLQVVPASQPSATCPTLPPFTATTLSPNVTAAPSLEPTAAQAGPVDSAQGPWLVYLVRQGQGPADLSDEPVLDELVLLNQDGSGRASIPVPGCEPRTPITIVENPANRLVQLSRKVFLFHPDLGIGQLVYQPYDSSCRSSYPDNPGANLLAIMNRSPDSGEPEIRLYEMPAGTLRAVLPLSQCSGADQACGSADLDAWPVVWSPDGRSLAYPVTLDGSESALYVFDSKSGESRPRGRLDGWIGDIWWYPGGTRIILGVSEQTGDWFISALWAVSPAGSEPRLLTPIEHPFPQDILAWLGEDRFLVYDGSLARIVEEGAFNLRLVDIPSGEVTGIFPDGFVSAALDSASETVSLSVTANNADYQDGIYLVSLANPIPRLIGPTTHSQLSWNAVLGLFVASQACADDPESNRAFDPTGAWRCVRSPGPMEVISAPDGRWKAVMRDGLWVETEGEALAQVFEATPTQLIWLPDSSGFFFIADQVLYHVSLSDLAAKAWIEKLGKYEVLYQWVE